MGILGSEAITMRRWTGAASADSSISASVQPLTGKEAKALPAEHRFLDQKRLYTTTALRVLNPEDLERPDQVVIGGDVYDVWQVKRERSLIPHYRVLVARRAYTTITLFTPDTSTRGYGGAVTLTGDTDASLTAIVSELTAEEIESAAGEYQLGDLRFQVYNHLLTSGHIPTIGSRITYDDGSGSATWYAYAVERGDRGLMWTLAARRAS